ncbi:hypothetical protein V9T40_001541 [Parthenolecanium corni]|uniref:RAP domain-containing protein n=1 Tax=Parthenolecanium corni TaxID=536013 RepID=A0AAN9Y4P6_9HEMI
MKYFQIISSFHSPFRIISSLFRNHPPLSYSCSLYSHRNLCLPVCGRKFYSHSNTDKRPNLIFNSSSLIQDFAEVLQSGDLRSVASHPISVDCQKRLPDLDDHQFLTVLSDYDSFFQRKGGSLRYGFNKSNPLNWLMTSFDSECSKRFADGDFVKSLSILESHRFFLAVNRSKMINRVLRNNLKTPFTSPKPILRRYLAFMTRHHLWGQPFKFYQVEYALQVRLDELDVPDICSFLEAFIVTPSRYISNDELLISIFARFTNQLDSIHSSHLLTFLLFSNRQIYIYHYATLTPHVSKLLHFLNTNFEAYPLTCHINAVALSVKFLLHRPQYLQKICDAIVRMSEISVDAFLNGGSSGDCQARTLPLNVEDTAFPSSCSVKMDNGTPSISTNVDSCQLVPSFNGLEMKNFPSKLSDSTAIDKGVAENLPTENEHPLPTMVKNGHSGPRVASSFRLNRDVTPALNITQFTNTVAFFNCNDMAAQLKPFLESNRVSQYFLEASPELYVRAITYLAYIGHFSHLISTFLSEEFLLETYKRISIFNVPRYIPELDAILQIECPNCQSHRLMPEFRRKMADFMLAHYPGKVRFVDRETLRAIHKNFVYEVVTREFVLYKYTMEEAASLISELFGGDGYTHMCRALPHLSGENLIWCTDAAGKPQKLSAEVKEARTLNFEVIDTEELRWFILVCSSCNIHDKERVRPMVVGREVLKVRQMKLLGFQVVEVVHEEWETMSRDQRLSILKQKLSSSVAK